MSPSKPTRSAPSASHQKPRVTEVLARAELGPPPAGERPPRLGVLDGFGRAPDAAVEARYRRALDRLTEAGYPLREVRVDGLARGISLLAAIYPPEAAEFHRAQLESHPARISEAVRRDLSRGLSEDAADRRAGALEKARALTTRLEETLSDVDLLITPTTPQPARPFGSPEPYVLMTYTVAFNLAGWPALSLPMGDVDVPRLRVPRGKRLRAPGRARGSRARSRGARRRSRPRRCPSRQ